MAACGRVADCNISPFALATPSTDPNPSRCAGPALAMTTTEGSALGEVVILCAVCEVGATVEEAEVRIFLRSKLAAYKVPKRVLFFRPEELSFTGNQKIQVDPLRESAQKRLEAEGAEIDGYRYEAKSI